MDTSRTTEGFLVVESVPIPFSKQSKLLLWVAYDPVPDSAVQYAAEVETLARETGHRQIEILTPHKGLWGLAQQFGYTLKWAVLNKELKE